MKAKVEFSYGDFRIDKLVKNFYQSIIEKGSICIRAIAGCRKKEVSFHRLIKNKKFTAEKMIQEAVTNTQSIITNEDHILCIQDSSEFGVSDVIHWTRKEKVIEKDKNGKSIRDYDYKKLSLEERESHRWIKLSENTKTKFSHAKK